MNSGGESALDCPEFGAPYHAASESVDSGDTQWDHALGCPETGGAGVSALDFALLLFGVFAGVSFLAACSGVEVSLGFGSGTVTVPLSSESCELCFFGPRPRPRPRPFPLLPLGLPPFPF